MSILTKISDFIHENSEIENPLFSVEFHCEITQTKLEEHLVVVKETLQKHKIPNTIVKKCYGVIVEALENAKKHASKKENYTFVFHKFEIGIDSVQLCFGNYVSEKDVANLQKHLEIIQREDTRNIKNRLYEKASDGEPLSDKGDAGVGIYDMALKANGKIKYSLFKINSKYYYLTFIKIK